MWWVGKTLGLEMNIISKIRLFRKDEKGVTMIEYGLLAALIPR